MMMITIVAMRSQMRSNKVVYAFILILLLLFVTGCATSSTTVVDEEVVTNQKPMAAYKSLIITDFELKKELFTDVPEEKMSERERRYAQIPAVLAENIERYVKSRHIYGVVERNSPPLPNSLVLKGKFTRIGRFRISIVAMLYDGDNGHEVAYFRQTLWDVLDTTEAVNLLGRDIADFIDRIQYK